MWTAIYFCGFFFTRRIIENPRCAIATCRYFNERDDANGCGAAVDGREEKHFPSDVFVFRGHRWISVGRHCLKRSKLKFADENRNARSRCVLLANILYYWIKNKKKKQTKHMRNGVRAPQCELCTPSHAPRPGFNKTLVSSQIIRVFSIASAPHHTLPIGL